MLMRRRITLFLLSRWLKCITLADHITHYELHASYKAIELVLFVHVYAQQISPIIFVFVRSATGGSHFGYIEMQIVDAN